MDQKSIDEINRQLRNATPKEIIEWAVFRDEKMVLTTNFRPYESAILHAVTNVFSAIPVIWCDTGYNTSYTYEFAENLIHSLNLNLFTYVPQQTVAHRTVTMGIPAVEDENHRLFTEQVKLEPFQRAMREHQPKIWFTNLRKGQTALRDSLDIVSIDKQGVIKVCPFFYYSDEELDDYLATHSLPNETRYYDPTKALENRECGLHQ